MPTLNLLYKHDYKINDKLTVRIPTLGEVVDNEDNYYGVVNVWTAVPIDYMVELDEAGIDFSKITDYDLFQLLFVSLQSLDTTILFGDLDFSKFVRGVNEENGEQVFIYPDKDIVIDRSIYNLVSSTLRKINGSTKNTKKPAGEETKKYMLERARVKRNRNKNRKRLSQLEMIITALVNSPQFKYDYDSIRDLTIYQFEESAKQVIKRVDYDNRMIGVYAGTVDVKSLSEDDLNWLIHK